MHADSIERLKSSIRDVPDFPKPGIIFKDIAPMLGDPQLLQLSIDVLTDLYADQGITKVAGIDARGFIFATGVAMKLGAGLVPVRKKGKLPWKTESLAYDLEYGSAEIEIHVDAVEKGEKVLLIDDLLATGGTAGAAQELLLQTGADLVGTAFVIELSFLNGRERLSPHSETKALITY